MESPVADPATKTAGSGLSIDASGDSVGRYLLVLTFFYLFATAANLQIQSISNPDEPRYAVPAREMMRGEDWIIPKFNTQERLVKPIFFYWLIATTGKVGAALGLDDVTAMRMGPVLMGLLAVLVTFLLGRSLRNARFGFIAAGILTTARFFHEVSRDFVVDMTLTAFLACAWLCARYAIEQIQKSRSAAGALFGLYLSAGLACATKGPILVAVFIVIPFLIYLLWTGRLKTLAKAGLWWGVPLALILGLGWYGILLKMGYKEQILHFFLKENVGRAYGARLSQDHASNPLPFLFYIRNLGENFLPWTVLLPFAIWYSVRSAAGKLARISDSAKFLICAAAIPFFILGVIISKRALYLLPLYPMFALWVAWMIDDAWLCAEDAAKLPHRALSVTARVSAFIIIFLPAAASYTVPGFTVQELIYSQLICAGIAICMFMAGRHLSNDLRYPAFLNILICAAALSFGAETVVRPIRERTANRQKFYSELCTLLAARHVVFFGGFSSNEAVWYLDRPHEPIDDINRTQLKERFFEAKETVMVVPQKALDGIPGLRDALIVGPERIVRGGESFALALPNPAHPPDPSLFERPKKAPVQPEDEGSSE